MAALNSIWYGLDNVRKKRIRNFRVYTECKNAADILNWLQMTPWDLENLVVNIKQLGNEMLVTDWIHFNRNCNQVAHAAAKQGLYSRVEGVWDCGKGIFKEITDNVASSNEVFFEFLNANVNLVCCSKVSSGDLSEMDRSNSINKENFLVDCCEVHNQMKQGLDSLVVDTEDPFQVSNRNETVSSEINVAEVKSYVNERGISACSDVVCMNALCSDEDFTCVIRGDVSEMALMNKICPTKEEHGLSRFGGKRERFTFLLLAQGKASVGEKES
ncbi:hypothetical protein Cni_G14210 [Canna indica]|uniref:RNase H type-1 domain-containing protein n=1 Tax=Canna indica TaxID=4628 RepID=A0AAQ3QAG1_9LILI|nr:hypothetical protein Cni_G14210 [Canna indica]